MEGLSSIVAEQTSKLSTLEGSLLHLKNALPDCFATQETSLTNTISASLSLMATGQSSNRGPSLAVSSFAGNPSEDFKAWLENEFELKYRANNWPDAGKARVLAGYLTDHALFLYKPLADAVKDNYATLVTELEKKLLTVDRIRYLTQQYEARVQGVTESVSAYARGLNDQAKSALSYMTQSGEKEINLRDRFVAGLRPEIQSQVTLWAPESFQKALTAAERIETVTVDAKGASDAKFEAQLQKLSEQMAQLVPNAMSKENRLLLAQATPSGEPTPVWAMTLMSKMEKLEATDSGADCRPGLPTAGRTHPITSSGPSFPMYAPQRFTTGRRQICQVCNKTGHTARNCRQLGQYCEFHRTSGHRTQDCRARQQQQRFSQPLGYGTSQAVSRGGASGENGGRNRWGNRINTHVSGVHWAEPVDEMHRGALPYSSYATESGWQPISRAGAPTHTMASPACGRESHVNEVSMLGNRVQLSETCENHQGSPLFQSGTAFLGSLVEDGTTMQSEWTVVTDTAPGGHEKTATNQEVTLHNNTSTTRHMAPWTAKDKVEQVNYAIADAASATTGYRGFFDSKQQRPRDAKPFHQDSGTKGINKRDCDPTYFKGIATTPRDCWQWRTSVETGQNYETLCYSLPEDNPLQNKAT